jgi:hypothetical protein
MFPNRLQEKRVVDVIEQTFDHCCPVR